MSTGRDATAAVPRRARPDAARSGWWATAVLILVVLVAGGALWLQGHDVRQAKAATVASRTAASIGAGFAGLVEEVESVAPRLALDVASATPAGARSIQWLPAGAAGPRLGSPGLASALQSPAVRAALSRTRDRGGPVLAAPAGTPPTVTVLVLAVYTAVDGSPTLDGGATTAERRSSFAGLVVVDVDPAELVGSLASPWALRDGAFSVAGDATVSGDVVSSSVDVLERRWILDVGVAGGVGGLFWATAGLGVLGVLVVAGVEANRRRSAVRRAADVASARSRAESIRTLAQVVQGSSDLSTILPSLAVQLVDELGLVGVSLSIGDHDGDARETFVHGRQPVRDARSRPGAPVLVGQTHAVDLHRGSRSIAVLRVIPGRPLSSDEVDLLQVAGEMITSSVVAARSSEQQQNALDRLRAVDDLKSTFLGVASHELRTPVTAISGLASLMSEHWDALSDAERKTFADRISANASSLVVLVQDLLDMARLERGDVDLVLGPVDLGSAVDQVLERLSPVWETHDVTRSIAAGISVHADVTAIERIVTNLVSNAVKFSPLGTVVGVSVERGSMGGRLIVDDCGPGVPAEEREQIFVRFFRGRGNEVVRTRGVGIGLSVVHDFVEQMEGTIVVDESQAGGARFVVELPATKPNADTPEEIDDVTP